MPCWQCGTEQGKSNFVAGKYMIFFFNILNFFLRSNIFSHNYIAVMFEKFKIKMLVFCNNFDGVGFVFVTD